MAQDDQSNSRLEKNLTFFEGSNFSRLNLYNEDVSGQPQWPVKNEELSQFAADNLEIKSADAGIQLANHCLFQSIHWIPAAVMCLIITRALSGSMR